MKHIKNFIKWEIIVVLVTIGISLMVRALGAEPEYVDIVIGLSPVFSISLMMAEYYDHKSGG